MKTSNINGKTLKTGMYSDIEKQWAIDRLISLGFAPSTHDAAYANSHFATNTIHISSDYKTFRYTDNNHIGENGVLCIDDLK